MSTKRWVGPVFCTISWYKRPFSEPVLSRADGTRPFSGCFTKNFQNLGAVKRKFSINRRLMRKNVSVICFVFLAFQVAEFSPLLFGRLFWSKIKENNLNEGAANCSWLHLCWFFLSVIFLLCYLQYTSFSGFLVWHIKVGQGLFQSCVRSIISSLS